jgi:hypothetical protein
VAVGTVFVTVGFWAMAYGVAVAAAGTPADPDQDTTMIAAGGIALAVLLMPAGFAGAALVSRRPDWPLAVLASMGLAVAIGLPLLWFRNPLASLLAGYAAGAVTSLSLPAGATWHNRAIGAAVVAFIAVAGMAVAFPVVALIGPALPFTAAVVADRLPARTADRRLVDSPRTG